MKLLLNSGLFEYDIRGLLMAFYPGMKFETDAPSEDEDFLSVQYGEGTEELPCTVRFSAEGKDTAEELVLDMRNRAEAKTKLKQVLYHILSETLGHELPWGTLSGIRPTKIPMAMIENGKTDEEILSHMEGELYCSKEKSELSLGIAKRELSLLRKIDYEEGYSLYIGIPFCPTTCLYCSFTSFPLEKYKDRVWDYLHTLSRELDFAQEQFAGKKLNTVYFGGGTPTTLSEEQLDWLCHEVVTRFDLSSCLEWTVEAGRPDSVTEGKLQVLKKYPVTRISVNPQTMHQKTLDLIGRRHTVDQVRDVYRMAREAGFDNINMDLILGLPGETEEDVRQTIEEVCRLDPDNVTIHSLALKRASRLNRMIEEYRTYRMENTDEMMELCRKELQKIGQEPYYLYRQKNMAGNLENTGYARAGKEGIYNILIMEEVQTILALGAGATTKRVDRTKNLITRAENAKNVDIYMQNIDEMLERKRKLFAD